jgi:WD40 repeat protein
MPPKSPPLPKETLDVVRAWIAGGALENAGSIAKVNKPKVDITLSSVTKGRPEGPPPMPEKPLSLEPIVRAARTTAVTALANNPWSPLVAVAGQKQVLLYNGDTLDPVGVLAVPGRHAHVLKFSRNGSLLLAAGGRGGKSGRASSGVSKTGERIFEVGDESDAVLAADISADQTQSAVGGPSKVIRVYSTRDGSLLREIKKHTDWIYSLEYSPDGVLLATGDRNGGLFVWEAYTGREYFSLRGHTAAVTGVSWRADSNVVASCSEDSTIRLWEMENGGQVRNWGAHGGGALSVRYGHDGRLVSAGRDRVVKVWDGNGAQQRAFEAYPDVALRATFTHDGNRVIAGDWTGSVRVFATADGKPLGNLSTNPPSVAERLDAVTKDVAAKEAAHQQLVAAAKASQDAATKTAADLAAAQQAVTTTAAAARRRQKRCRRPRLPPIRQMATSRRLG